MDLDFRLVVRGGTQDEIGRAAQRAPADALREVHDQLTKQRDALNEKLAVLDVVAPRCHCGRIGEPRCDVHEGALEAYLQVKNSYAGMGLLARWVAGEDIAKEDVKQLVEFHQQAGCPDELECQFPTCPVGAFGYYCVKHRGLRLPEARRSRAKKREEWTKTR